MSPPRIFIASLSLCALASCGETPGAQAALGAGAGGAAAAATDSNVVAGAVVGAAVNISYCRRYPARC